MNQAQIWNKLYKSNLTWKLEARNLPNILKSRVVLELGVGTGKTLNSILKQKPKEVIALDFSQEAISLINKNFSKVKAINASLIKMPFKNSYFDLVVCYFTLNNLKNIERVKAINEIYRILKPKGILLFQDFAQGDFRESKSEQTKEAHTIQKKNGIICHFFNKNELKELLSKFSSINTQIKESTPITHKPNLKRRVILTKAIK